MLTAKLQYLTILNDFFLKVILASMSMNKFKEKKKQQIFVTKLCTRVCTCDMQTKFKETGLT